MKYYYDLHIHTALSPCGDSDMTPNNIVNMSILKGLDFIAITDHNTTGNLKAVMECARDKDIIVVPGIEVESREEVHMICLFPTLQAAENISLMVKTHLPNIVNRPDIFGPQILYDRYDHIIGYEEKLLVTATFLSIEEIKSAVESVGGVVIPAHIDRTSFSIISNLGFIPKELNFTAVEISNKVNIKEFVLKNEKLNSYHIITNSDAHYLHEISEPEHYLKLEEKSIDCIFHHFLHHKNF